MAGTGNAITKCAQPDKRASRDAKCVRLDKNGRTPYRGWLTCVCVRPAGRPTRQASDLDPDR